MSVVPTGAASDAAASYRHRLLCHELRAVVGDGHVSDDPDALDGQAADWSWMAQHLRLHGRPLPTADVVVRPGTAGEVADVLRIADDHRVPVVPRGGGSGTQGGTFALFGGIALDLGRLDTVDDVDTASLTVTAGAGITGPALDAALAPHDLMLAHEPGSYHFGATLGGWLAARGSGVASTKYGKPEEMVLQLDVAFAGGRTATTQPVPNHAAGPDLLQVLVGSEGTLGVITRARMRLDPVPASREFLAFAFDDVLRGLEAGRRIMTARWRPAVMRLYDQADRTHLNRVLGLSLTGALLVVVCDGDPRLTALEAEAVTDICTAAGADELGAGPARAWWDGRFEPYAHGKAPAPPTIFGTTDTVTTFDRLPALYRAKKAAIEDGSADAGARYTAHFSHWFPWGAMVYDRFYVDDPPDDPDEALALHDRLWDRAVATSLAHGGTINEHHGVGVKLGRFMRAGHGGLWPLLRAIKDGVDPHGIMNPGKLGFGPPR